MDFWDGWDGGIFPIDDKKDEGWGDITYYLGRTSRLRNIMVAHGSSACPFFAGGMIKDSRFFVGRQDEVGWVMRAIANVQPTNVNLIGDPKTGKSSLLQHIYQTYESRVGTHGRRAEEFVVVYVSLKDGRYRSPDDFYQTIAQKLLERGVVQANPTLVGALQGVMNGARFSQVMEVWKQVGVLPVICLDEFEEVLEPGSAFDDHFFDNLRSLSNASQLMLVIASRKPLRDYKMSGYTSEFFNISQTRVIGDFSEAEAGAIVALPGVGQSVLGTEQQTLALTWGKRQPCLLQLAAKCLWDAQQDRRSDAWAKEQFDRDAKAVPRKKVNVGRSLFLGISWVGSLGQNIGNALDDWGNFVKGAMILAIALGFVFKVVPWQDGLKFLQTQKDEVLKNGETK